MMDEWMGKTVTIDNPKRVTIKEDGDKWTWREADFEHPIVFLPDDLFEI